MSSSFTSVTSCLSMFFFPQLLKLAEGCPTDRLPAGHGISCSLFIPPVRPYTARCIHSFPCQVTFDCHLLNRAQTSPSPGQLLTSFPELWAAGQSDTCSPMASVAASSPLWHLRQYRPQRDFLYCIKLAERRFSRCVAVPLTSCDPVSQQILPWL